MSVRMGIENINAVMDLGAGVDLESIHERFGEGKKHTVKTGSILYRIRKPKASVEIFASGKVMLTGLITLGDMEAAKSIVLADLAKVGIVPKSDPVLTISNLVASGDLGMAIDLPSTLLLLGADKAEYEPEQFPGLIYRLDEPKVTVLLFNSGKIICTGTSDAGLIAEAADIVSERLKSSQERSHLSIIGFWRWLGSGTSMPSPRNRRSCSGSMLVTLYLSFAQCPLTEDAIDMASR